MTSWTLQKVTSGSVVGRCKGSTASNATLRSLQGHFNYYKQGPTRHPVESEEGKLGQMIYVACKRFFHVSQDPETQGRKLRALSLQGMTNDFMDREVESRNIPFPPFSVTKLCPRFVECGVALAMQSGTLGGSFLVEEEIRGKFMKVFGVPTPDLAGG
ncbi:hypothetical protein C8J56DRAFT_900065 [Mycena floridula]|nr:hypothetical protein C8J56DRAFT_900065 [Mycena floridula]